MYEEKKGKKDLVSKLPQEIAVFFKENGKYPDNFKIEEGFVCALEGERYFIHTVAVLPPKAFTNGVGFGLWVEISKDEFMKYINLSDEEYTNYRVEGKLANHWPGFENMIGAKVIVSTIDPNKKVYITEVLEVNDVLLRIALDTSSTDEAGIDRIWNLILAYMEDIGSF